MAITKNAKKSIRTSQRKRVFNIRRKAVLHDTVKTLKTTLTKGSAKEAEALMATAYKAIDKAAKRGIIKKNTASRKKSRLMAQLKKSTTK
jgi:small subunit ribosomal protein S20